MEDHVHRVKNLGQCMILTADWYKPQIETITDRKWDLPIWPDLDNWWKEYDNVWHSLPGYDYLIYLRHHGFPSPLLDWSRSPYVAAQFAFANAYSDQIAIYAYLEYAGRGKVGGSDAPLIKGIGPYVRSHSRHFLQQSEYTVAYQFRKEGWWYAPHESVFADASEEQDRLWKFTLPATERLRVLRILDDYNLNAFSLFQTEETLLETISLREFEFAAPLTDRNEN